MNPVVELAGAEDDGELRRLLRDNPVPGWVTLSFEREPSFFQAAAVEGDEHQVVLARDGDRRVIGLGTRSMLDAYVNGRPCRIEYLSQLRLDRQHRGRGSIVRRGYRLLQQLHAPGTLSITTVIADNTTARRFLEKGVPGIPPYRPVGRLITCVLPTRAGPAATLQPLSDTVIELQQRWGERHQLTPLWNHSTLTSDRVHGLGDDWIVLDGACAALWDQRAIRQSVVRGYRPLVSAVRPIAPLFGLPAMPRVGQPLGHAFLSHIAVDGGDFTTLVRQASAAARRRGLDALVLGLDARNPLLSSLRRRFRCIEYESIVYTVEWDDAAPTLDDRTLHLEVACL